MPIGAVALLITLVTAGAFALIGFLHASKRIITLEEFVSSRNQFGNWMTFATLVASAMGVWILFSPPEVGATSGVAGILGYCLGSAAPIALFIQIGPRIRQLMPNGHSLNEFVLYRFGQQMYGLTLAIIVFYMFVYLTAELTGIAKAVQILADVPLGWTALLVMAATFVYTTYGGLATTIFTDMVQFVVIVPLLLISLTVTILALGGLGPALQPIQQNAPELLSFSNLPGLKFGATLFIAVLVAEIFNQGNWQRIYAARNNQTVRTAFLASSLIILPMLFVAGSLGILGMHFGFNSDQTFFSLIQQLQLPFWFFIAILILALALVMSSVDTLLNGITSVFTLDLVRLWPHMQTAGHLRATRVLTVVIGSVAVAIAAQGYNVLYLFLLADLVCAGAFIPILLGLYSRQITGTVALVSCLAGIAAGALFFPKPDYSPWLPIPFGGDLLVSFVASLVVSTIIALTWQVYAAYTAKGDRFNFEQMKEQVHPYMSLVDSLSDE
ncbi:sodium:solute symporter family transporter [Leptolyngbya sp. AN02str]|uniref:sodium:solute symporter family transporter n=1 Tax=Leptolyngbya sp. AN02str TaxID=3423363 RepID=UPI003D311658